MENQTAFQLTSDRLFEQIIDIVSKKSSFNDLSSSARFFIELLSNFPSFEFASLFLINPVSMEFDPFLTLPYDKLDFSNEVFNMLVDCDDVGEAVGSRSLKLNRENPWNTFFLVHPLISNNDCIGLVILNVSAFDRETSPRFYYAMTLITTFFANVIETQMLKQSQANNEQILEQRIAERTIALLKSKAEMHEKFGDLRTNLTMALPHEIRTPLGLIMGNSDFLVNNLNDLDPDDLKEIVADISDSSKRINMLFENYIYFANLELIAIDPMALEKLQSSTIDGYARMIQDYSYIISNRFNRIDDLKVNLIEAKVFFSESHFVKLINEIIDNSFKYSNAGSFVVIDSYSIEDNLFISFIDHGRGMSAEQISALDAYIQFERFKYEQQGLGLGLAIVRRLVNIHNGELTIESEYGKYTKFTIKLKIASQDAII